MSRRRDATLLSRIVYGVILCGIVFVPFFFIPGTRDPLQFPKQVALLVFALLGCVLWLLEGIVARQIHFSRTFIDAFLALYGGTIVVSGVLSFSPAMSFFGNTENFVLHVCVNLLLVLWFYLFVSHVRTPSQLSRFIWTLLLVGATSEFIFITHFFLGTGTSSLSTLIQRFFAIVGFNTVTGINSLFGIYSAIICIIALGIASLKTEKKIHATVALLVGILSFVTLCQLGFVLPWVIAAVGFGLLAIMGYVVPGLMRLGVLSFVFFLFLASILFAMNGTPSILKQSIPVEVALGASTSWDISTAAFLTNAKQFLIGTGPGTFVYNFSQYRPDSFNMQEVARNLRFYQPYSTMIAMISEIGSVGTIAFIFIIFLALGGAIGGWQTVLKQIRSKIRPHVSENTISLRLDGYILCIGWIAATVGLFVSFYDVVGWLLWWSLLAGMLAGVSHTRADFVEEKIVSLNVSSQHFLALSFGMVLVFTCVCGAVGYGVRFLLAERAYTRAAATSDMAAASDELHRAIEYRPGYVPYHIVLSRVSLERARLESQKSVPNTDLITSDLSAGISEAKLSTEKDSHNVDAWDTLAVMYVNAGSFTKDARTWAVDSLQKAVALEPSNAGLWYRLAALQDDMGSTADAERSYRSAINKQPDLVQAYAGITGLYEKQQRIDEAIALYENVGGVIQNNTELLYQWGRLLYNRNKTGDVDRAEQIWLHAVDLQPDFSNALFSLGVLYEKKGDRAKALQYYRKVSALNPQNTDVKKKIQTLSS